MPKDADKSNSAGLFLPPKTICDPRPWFVATVIRSSGIYGLMRQSALTLNTNGLSNWSARGEERETQPIEQGNPSFTALIGLLLSVKDWTLEYHSEA